MTAIYFSCFKSYLRDHVYGSVRYYLKMKKKYAYQISIVFLWLFKAQKVTENDLCVIRVV